MSVESLTKQQLTDYQEAFRLFDRDNDGMVNTQELGTLMRSLGSNPTNAAVADIVAKLNKDLIDFPTFAAVMARQNPLNDTAEDIKKAFAVFDKENTGRVDSKTLRHYLVSVGETLTQEEADNLLKRADPKGQGFVDYNQFVTLMMAQ